MKKKRTTTKSEISVNWIRIFAASLGTVAACLSSLSSVTIEDLLIDGMNMKMSSQKAAFYAKWLSVG